MRWRRSARERQSRRRGAGPNPSRRYGIESLEPRILLSADPILAGGWVETSLGSASTASAGGSSLLEIDSFPTVESAGAFGAGAGNSARAWQDAPSALQPAPSSPSVAEQSARSSGPSPAEGPLAAMLFVVDTTSDVDDGQPAGQGETSLRKAIRLANQNAGKDTIRFSLGGAAVIFPNSALPTIMDPVSIDGSFEGLPTIEISGVSAGAAGGLHITAGDSEVRGLIIHSFQSDGILIEGAGGNLVVGNYVGTGPNGTFPFPNLDGIEIHNSPDNTISGNVVSGNQRDGIVILNSASIGNRVVGNFVGTDPTGQLPVPNGRTGVLVSSRVGTSDQASGTIIGGSSENDRNLISGNGFDGLQLFRSEDNQILGNYIGTDLSGENEIPNARNGIRVFESSFNEVGAPGAGNLVSGNTEAGIGIESVDQAAQANFVRSNTIGTDKDGTDALPNLFGLWLTSEPGSGGVTLNTIGGDDASDGAEDGTISSGNLISGNSESGIGFTGAATQENTVEGNRIGTNRAGAAAIPNGIGVHLTSVPAGGSASNNTIGGTTPGAGNIIAGNRSSDANAGDGIQITAGSSGNRVLGNFIGTTPSSAVDLGNGRHGIAIFDASGNTIGGTEAGARNVISGNAVAGVSIGGEPPGDGENPIPLDNTVLGNHIGTNVDATEALANAVGVLIEARGNTVGGVASDARNVISGNLTNGISISGAFARENRVLSNRIGTDATGLLPVPNAGNGIRILDASFNEIGAAGSGNLISGNVLDGINISAVNGTADANKIRGNQIGLSATGTSPVGNLGTGIFISSTLSSSGARLNRIGGDETDPDGSGNTISGNALYGVALVGAGTELNSVFGNVIGLDPSGSLVLGNGTPGLFSAGVYIGGPTTGAESASDNTVGGTTSRARNLISGNAGDGVQISFGATGNDVLGNYIGTNAAGSFGLGNQRHGVAILGSSDNVIGGATAATRNLISGNQEQGILISSFLEGTVFFASQNNGVFNNYVGTEVTGTAALWNERNGILLNVAEFNLIGGTDAGNLISGNRENGVLVLGLSSVDPSLGAGNRISGNFIGTEADGLDALEVSANGGDGIRIESARQTVVGDPAFVPGSGNVISANGRSGIHLLSADGTRVLGNIVGAVPGVLDDGDSRNPLGNRLDGIHIEDSRDVVIGLPDQSQGNTITKNGISFLGSSPQDPRHGVFVDKSSSRIAIRGNSIYGNGARGIDLESRFATGDTAFTVNDLLDADSGANDLQNHPIVTHVSFPVNGGSALPTIEWTLYSTPNTTFVIDFYSNMDPSSFGEGTSYIASVSVVTDASGVAVFERAFDPGQQFISTTAMRAGGAPNTPGSTSEFSPVDTDGDGLANAWEINGIDVDEVAESDPWELKLDTNFLRKDLFVEIDGLVGAFVDQKLLDLVAKGREGFDEGFANAPAELVQDPLGIDGINLHIELSEVEIGNTWDPKDPDEGLAQAQRIKHGLDGGDHKDGFFGGPGDRVDLDWELIRAARLLVYRYGLIVPTLPKAGGVAESGPSNDFVVASSRLAPGRLDTAGAIMHELGHTLGLRHGGWGDPSGNYKPNHRSIMNYLWARPWLWQGTNFRLDYSREKLPDLNELLLDESAGFGGDPAVFIPVGPVELKINDDATILTKAEFFPEGGKIDLNGNGDTNERVQRDVNNFATEGTDLGILRGSEEWSHLHYALIGPSDAFADAVSDDIAEVLNALGVGPGRLQFTRIGQDVGEHAGSVTLRVTRAGGVDGAVSVDYSVTGGFAVSGEDYLADSGTLTFTDGQYAREITIPIVNDQVAEAGETFDVMLSNPTGGATLGEFDRITVEIEDDDYAAVYVVRNNHDSGPGSLRQAILDANETSIGTDLIRFAIPGFGPFTIQPLLLLPQITESVIIDGYSQFGARPNAQGVGSDAVIRIELDGSLAGVGSGGHGLRIAADDSLVRGLAINRFAGSGIYVDNGSRNAIEGNFIGTDVTGLVPLGNANANVRIASTGGTSSDGSGGGDDNRVGGTTLAARNVIGGGHGDGVQVHSFATSNVNPAERTHIQGNVIGVAADGSSPLGNAGAGVFVIAADFTVVGGLEPGAGNVIAHNARNGVGVAAPVPVEVRGNSIWGNGLLGIGLDSGDNNLFGTSGLVVPIANNPGDLEPPSGNVTLPNGFRIQNFPVLQAALAGDGSLTVEGMLDSLADQSFEIDFYANTTIDPSGYGPGETYLGTRTVTTGPDGLVTFSETLPYAAAEGAFITATATDVTGRTSQFSARIAVGDRPVGPFVVNSADDVDDGRADLAHTSLREAILAANNHPGPDVITFAIPGSGVQTIRPTWLLPPIFETVAIDGYTQPGASANTLLVGNDAVLGIEIDGSALDPDQNVALNLGDGLLLISNGSLVRGLVINGFPGAAIQVNSYPTAVGLPAVGNRIEGNFLGTEATGTIARPNENGILISGGLDTIVGGPDPAARNLVSGNREEGIRVVDRGNSRVRTIDGLSQTTGTLIQGNYVGTDRSGTAPLGNGTLAVGESGAHGIDVHTIGPGGNLIGGREPGTGNVISGNVKGVLVGSSVVNLGGGILTERGTNRVLGNLIGTDASGEAPLGNVEYAVRVSDGQIVGEPGAGNVISATTGEGPNAGNINAGVGVWVTGFDVVLQGNFIGTNRDGTQPLGNASHGIYLNTLQNVQNPVTGAIIGGSAPGEGNVISGNAGAGIAGFQAGGTTIRGNRIGTDASGTVAIGNQGDGVFVRGSGLVVGGTEAGAGNVIAFNRRNGVFIDRGGAGGALPDGENSILGNSIFDNAWLGINLWDNVGVEQTVPTQNDPGDTDEGANRLQNFPVLTGFSDSNGDATLEGMLDSAPDTSFRVEFFWNDNADPSSFGEGRDYLGFADVTTGTDGIAFFSVTLAGADLGPGFLTATTTDPEGNTSEFSRVLGIFPLNAPPLARDDEPADFVFEAVPIAIDVLANDEDSDGSDDIDPASVTVVIAPAKGTTSVDPLTGAITYTSFPDQYGSDEFTYKVTDRGGLSSNEAVVSFYINPVDDPPVAVDDFASTPADVPVEIDILVNDLDDFEDLDPFGVALTSLPSNGTLESQLVFRPGRLVYLAIYTPDPGFAGTDTFTYTVPDGSGGVSGPATVTIEVVGAANEAPLARADAASTDEDVAIAIDVLSNDEDPEGALDPVSVVVTIAPTSGTFLVDPATGVVTYTPDPDFFGSDAFQYTVRDAAGAVSDPAMVAISVLPVNDAPVARDDSALTGEDVEIIIGVLANDSDIDSPLEATSVVVTTGPANGSVSVDPTTGALTYIPASNFFGADSLEYTVADVEGAVSNPATVSITVLPVNDAPVARDDAVTTDEDVELMIDVLANDSDLDGSLDLSSVTITADPANGTVAIDPTTGVLTYTPGADFFGDDSLQYTVADDEGLVSNTATVSITVLPVNDPPIALEDAARTVEGVALAIDVLANDFDPDGALDPASVAIATAPANGSFSIDPTTGAITYIPDALFSGTDTFQYTVADAGGLVSNAATVRVMVESVGGGDGVEPGQTGTIGFWQNPNGQALLRALNGGSDATALGDWLAASFPRLWGAEAGAGDLTGRSNAEVADFYTALFERKAKDAPPGPAKLDVQALALGFALYVTDVDLARTLAGAYGFVVDAGGVGARLFDVGGAGEAFGVPDGTRLAVRAILQAAHDRAREGLLYDLDGSGGISKSEKALRTFANQVISAINETGDRLDLAPTAFETRDEFDAGTSGLFTPFGSSSWSVLDGRLEGRGLALATLPGTTVPGTTLAFSATITPAPWLSGLVFDYHGPGEFKLAIVSEKGVALAHFSGGDSHVAVLVDQPSVLPGTAHELALTLAGGHVSLMFDGVERLVHGYDEVVTDGRLGLLSLGTGGFDDVRMRGAAGALLPPVAALRAAEAAVPGGGAQPLAFAAIEAVVDAAEAIWITALGEPARAAFEDVRFEIADLEGLALGETAGDVIRLDATAAGFGWFVDATPLASEEFAATLADGALRAEAGGAASEQMDLLSVVVHELGHVLGADPHEDLGAVLAAGTRQLPGAPPGHSDTAPAYTVRVLFDEIDEPAYHLREIALGDWGRDKRPHGFFEDRQFGWLRTRFADSKTGSPSTRPWNR